MTFVKICGLTTAEAVSAALAAGADALGFVIFEPSPRHVSPADAARLAAPARGRAKIVAVVVDASYGELTDIADTLAPDVVQHHGREDAAQIEIARTPAPKALMWKALPIAAPADLDAADRFPNVNWLLLDAKPPADADRPGGHGAAFDWSLLADWNAPKPWILSGGLTPENVADAIAATGATAVDVSSGVESAPGVKDPAKIAAFVAAAKAAQPSDTRP